MWATDTVERARDGMHRHLQTCLDPVPRLCSAVSFPIKKLLHRLRFPSPRRRIIHRLLPPMHFVLSDNGAEFQSAFDQTPQSVASPIIRHT